MLWISGCLLARQLPRLKACTAMELGTTIFLMFCMMTCGLEKLGLVDQIQWSVICPV